MPGLKNGTTRKKTGKAFGGYSFQGNSLDIFQQFFGSANPYTDSKAAVEEVAPKEVEEESEDKPKDIELCLACTIHEFYNGSIKKVQFVKQKLEPDDRSVVNVDEEMTVEVKPGYDVDTVLTFPSRGHEAYA